MCVASSLPIEATCNIVLQMHWRDMVRQSSTDVSRAGRGSARVTQLSGAAQTSISEAWLTCIVLRRQMLYWLIVRCMSARVYGKLCLQEFWNCFWGLLGFGMTCFHSVPSVGDGTTLCRSGGYGHRMEGEHPLALLQSMEGKRDAQCRRVNVWRVLVRFMEV